MKLATIGLLSLGITLVGSFSVKAEIAQINNPSWEEVPGAKLINPQEGFEDPFFVDTNGILRKGDIVTYDIVAPDTSYSRRQTNCKTKKSRMIRQGYFESRTRIVFDTVKVNNDWSADDTPIWKTISKFVCKR